MSGDELGERLLVPGRGGTDRDVHRDLLQHGPLHGEEMLEEPEVSHECATPPAGDRGPHVSS
jgi:hypothetical protein